MNEIVQICSAPSDFTAAETELYRLAGGSGRLNGHMTSGATFDGTIVSPVKPSRGWIGFPLIVLFAMLSTLPGWMPQRVYVAPEALDAGSSESQAIHRTATVAAQLRHAQWPLWDPASGLGEPLLERGLVGAFAPTILPHLLLKPTWTWVISTASRLAIAGIGLWLLAGRHRLRGVPRFIAAETFMLGALNLAHFNESLLNLVPWLPWAVLDCEWLVARSTWPRVILVAFLFAGQFLTGDPAASICLLATVAAVMFLNLIWANPRRAIVSIPGIMLAILLGAALAGIQWVPLWGYARQRGWPMPVEGSPSVAILWMWSLPLWMVISMFVGLATELFGGGGRGVVEREKRVPSAQPLKKCGVSGLAVVMLLAISIYRQRGVTLDEFGASRPIIAHSLSGLRKELPLAWGVPKSLWFRQGSELMAAMSGPGFDPTSSVLLMDAVSPDTADWLNRILPDRHENKSVTRSFWDAPPVVESSDQSDNQIHVRLKSGGNGWVVISGAFADGWTARTRPTGPLGAWAIRREQIVVPADGRRLAVPVAVNVPFEISLEYWPVAFRRGLLVSSAGLMVVVLLLGFAMFPARHEKRVD